MCERESRGDSLNKTELVTYYSPLVRYSSLYDAVYKKMEESLDAVGAN